MDTQKPNAKARGQSGYDQRYGEADLLEAASVRGASVNLTAIALLCALLLCGAVVLTAAVSTFSPGQPNNTANITPSPVSGAAAQRTDELPAADTPALILATNTPFPTPRLATVTPAPPTATATFTPGPCERRVEVGDTLISLAVECGHRSQDVLAEILELNNLSAPEAVIAGQLIYIPWPTPTVDPNAASDAETPASVANAALPADDNASFESAIIDQINLANLPTPTETLLPGVMWHTVVSNENMVAIAYQYQTSAEVLSQLNPEITFSQCDYSLDTGGPTCTVLLIAGQQMRVPAPAPTPTLSPTPSGSETPTPSPTATFNAPSPLSPSNRALFVRTDLITLRWVPTGTLAVDEQYLVTVRDLTTGTTHTAFTSQLYYIVPENVQGQGSQRHEYEWTVSVVRNQDPASARFTTPPRLFTWEGRLVPTPTGASN
ncbi:MAG: LysM peptidoglycan-binding domain-containing protein [bacterium]|nr:LysM peptidoglycan-binding domain-containing protein [bacterium]